MYTCTFSTWKFCIGGVWRFQTIVSDFWTSGNSFGTGWETLHVSAHMQMMPPAHVEVIEQIPETLACRVCATQVVLRWMGIPACLGRSESRRVCWVMDVDQCCCAPAWGTDFIHLCGAACPNITGRCTDSQISSFHPISGLLSPLSCVLFSHTFFLGQQIWGFMPLSDTPGT